MGEPIKPISIYARIARTYARRASSLLPLAAIVFIPLGLLDAINLNAEFGALSPFGGLLSAAALSAIIVLALSTLIGEVFYSGAVAILLTGEEHGRAPSLSVIARRLNYRRLIAVDLIYGILVGVGLILLLFPGVAIFVWFGLAAPVVEIEGRGVAGALRRSWDLVRGRFWAVLLVLAPIELVGDAIARLAAGLIHAVLGHSLLGSWAAESVSGVFLSPIYALAAVLLTLELSAEKDGAGLGLDSADARP